MGRRCEREDSRGVKTNTMTDKDFTVIRRTSKMSFFDVKEIWRYRDLLVMLTDREIRLRYKQTGLGIIWTILQPLLPAIIFAVVFGMFAKLPSDGNVYLLFVFTGTMIWNLFSQSITRAGNSLVGNANLISKIYFPRILIPLSSICAVLFDFVITIIVLIVFMVIYKTPPTFGLAFAPFFLLLALVTATGISFWLSALNVKYRDFMYAMPFFIQVWLYATPVVYASSIIPHKFRWIFSINPAVGFVEGFRWAVLGKGTVSVTMIAVSSGMAVIAFITGLVYFKSTERSFADIV
jgi:lipopolysaccharide transport system permease protein